jgi:hypothetical protein
LEQQGQMRADRGKYTKLRYSIMQFDCPNRAAIPRPQVLMVAGSRNQSEEKTPAKSMFAGVLFLPAKSLLNNINRLES